MNTLLRTSGIKTFVIGCFILAFSCSSMGVTWMVGSYVGNGTTNHDITGLGFQPDFIMIKADAAQPAFVKTNTMTGAVSRQYTSVTPGVSDAIISFLPGGFRLGTNANVNTNGTTYYFYAIKKGTSVVTGTYTGNGSSSRTINAGGKTEWVLVFPEDDYGSSALFTNGSGGGYAYDSRWKTGSSVATGYGSPYSSFPATGFPVSSSSPYTNVNNVKYHYVGFIENAGECVISSFSGNSADNRNIAVTGFKPNFVMTTNTNSGGEMVMRGGNITGDKSQYLNNVANAGNLIQSVYASGSNGGFQVGSSSDVNYGNQHYLAFGGAAGGVLPIELLSFDLERLTDKKIRISWSTASEENNNHFTIERSNNSENFESIGQVMAAGNSNTRKDYEFIDENCPTNETIIYYRLSQTDNDGTSKTFNILAVECTETKQDLEVSIIQNPVTGDELLFDMKLPADAGMNVQIIDNFGNIISTLNAYYSRGTNRYAINIDNLKAGIYILNITDSNGSAKKSGPVCSKQMISYPF